MRRTIAIVLATSFLILPAEAKPEDYKPFPPKIVCTEESKAVPDNGRMILKPVHEDRKFTFDLSSKTGFLRTLEGSVHKNIRIDIKESSGAFDDGKGGWAIILYGNINNNYIKMNNGRISFAHPIIVGMTAGLCNAG